MKIHSPLLTNWHVLCQDSPQLAEFSEEFMKMLQEEPHIALWSPPQRPLLSGRVFGDPEHADSTHLTTTPIVRIEEVAQEPRDDGEPTPITERTFKASTMEGDGYYIALESASENMRHYLLRLLEE